MAEFGPLKVTRDSAGNPVYVTGNPVDGSFNYAYGPRAPFWTPAGYTGDFHSGVDIGAAYGTPIRAAADGLVVFSGVDAAGAQVVSIRHEDATGSLYVHMDGSMVPAGAVLGRGEVLGYVGSTGVSTGPHLHYMRMKYTPPFVGVATWYSRENLMDPMSPEGGFVEVLSPEPTPAERVTAGAFPGSGKQGLISMLQQAEPEVVVSEALYAGVTLRSMWRVVDGLWLPFYVGAPSAVNAGFLSRRLMRDTVLLVVAE